VSKLNRRTMLAAAAALAAPAPAFAAVDNRPGWTRTRNPAPLPLNVRVHTGEALITIREWLDGRPAVLALWATWCTPCLVEKPSQVAMSRRLEASGSRTRILALQTYDNVDLVTGRRMLSRLGASDLPNAVASEEAEAAFLTLFGPSDFQPSRTVMPQHLLIDSQGRELGRSEGLMMGEDGGYTYFEDDSTFEFLRSLP